MGTHFSKDRDLTNSPDGARTSEALRRGTMKLELKPLKTGFLLPSEKVLEEPASWKRKLLERPPTVWEKGCSWGNSKRDNK